MKQILNHRIVTLTRWVCVCVIIGSLSSQLAATVTAQEPTTEPTPLPTPTPAPTWTPTVVPTNTPDPAATPTVDPTAAARMVDFRADATEIDVGDCVTFSWVVRGDFDTIEFDQVGDGKVPVLVSETGSSEKCPTEDTTYELIVTWQDATKTKRSIKIEVKGGGDGGDGGNSSGGATATPAGTAVYVPVTPVPVIGTPASTIGGSGGVVVTPVGALGSVRVLPETGHVSPPMAQATASENGPATTSTEPGFWSTFAGWLAAISVAIVFTTLIMGSRIIRDSEASQ